MFRLDYDLAHLTIEHCPPFPPERESFDAPAPECRHWGKHLLPVFATTLPRLIFPLKSPLSVTEKLSISGASGWAKRTMVSRNSSSHVSPFVHNEVSSWLFGCMAAG
jgi:hypothetical protein